MRVSKKLTLFIIFMLLISFVSGCGAYTDRKQDDKIKIVCTIFPAYDWVREIVGESDNAVVSLLLKNGTDMHSYQPTADDIISLSDADLFIYVGGASDTWVDNAIKQAGNPDMKVINMMEVIGPHLVEEELAEGMEGHDEHTHGDECFIEYDEHIWLSFDNAIAVSAAIKDSLCEVDADNSDVYSDNYASYKDKLNALDDEYRKAVSNAKYDTLLFGDRFPFIYMVEDYGIKYYAAFAGCSAETEASFETIAFLAEKLNELGLPVVMTVDASAHDLAKSIISSTKAKNQTILEMNSMQSVTQTDIENGVTYIGIMEDNLDILRTALFAEQ